MPPTHSKKSGLLSTGTIALNRKARHEYFVEETLEAGIVLTGTEVKSLRAGRANITEAYAGEMEGELYLFNAHIPEYKWAGKFTHAPKRPRKLLVKKRERDKLLGLAQMKGKTLVPLALYFNKRGICKIELGIATGKKLHDKRQTEKSRDWQREKARVLKEGKI